MTMKPLMIIIVILIAIIVLTYLHIDRKVVEHINLRKKAMKENTGYYNLKELGELMLSCANDNGGYLPDANEWCDTLLEYNQDISNELFKHPKNGELHLDECNFAFNKNLSGKHLDSISEKTILLFEADGSWNLNGTRNLLYTRYSEKGYIRVLYFNQKIRNYWYYKKAIRDFSKDGDAMYYVKPRWSP